MDIRQRQKMAMELEVRCRQSVTAFDEFKFKDNHPCFEGFEGARFKPPTKSQRSNEAALTSELEESNLKALDGLGYKDIYDYSTGTEESSCNRMQGIIAAIKYCQLAVSCLVSQQTTLRCTQKQKVASAVLEAFSKSFGGLVGEISERKMEMTRLLVSNEPLASVSDERERETYASRIVSAMALGLLIGTLDTAALHLAGSYNTAKLFQKLTDTDTGRLLWLSILLERENEKQFCDVACNWIKAARSHNDWTAQIAISALTSRYMLTSTSLTKSAQDKLLGSVFNGAGSAKVVFLKEKMNTGQFLKDSLCESFFTEY